MRGTESFGKTNNTLGEVNKSLEISNTLGEINITLGKVHRGLEINNNLGGVQRGLIYTVQKHVYQIWCTYEAKTFIFSKGRGSESKVLKTCLVDFREFKLILMFCQRAEALIFPNWNGTL